MKIEHVIKGAVVALSIGAALTIAACAPDATGPSYPSPAPQRSVPAVTNNPAPPAVRWAPGGSAQTGVVAPPTDIAIGDIGPQPQPGEEIVKVPEGDWTYLAPPDSETPPDGDISLGPEPESPDTGPIDGE
jgi:hypothetical protein